MADTMTPEQRHKCMAAIKGKDTKPEMIVRKYLHSLGYRYGLHNKKLPGSPDLVLRKYKTVIFIHGCFWHGHEGCKYYRLPKSNVEFWQDKITRNRQRDRE
ncbi:MAG: DNA mismatch endonuclease Vsr, partial [Muribaculaceae bacterium]|nr:DNA mismatch endonuclease Vsr [Muribaculaceae bacterium]